MRKRANRPSSIPDRLSATPVKDFLVAWQTTYNMVSGVKLHNGLGDRKLVEILAALGLDWKKVAGRIRHAARIDDGRGALRDALKKLPQLRRKVFEVRALLSSITDGGVPDPANRRQYLKEWGDSLPRTAADLVGPKHSKFPPIRLADYNAPKREASKLMAVCSNLGALIAAPPNRQAVRGVHAEPLVYALIWTVCEDMQRQRGKTIWRKARVAHDKIIALARRRRATVGSNGPRR